MGSENDPDSRRFSRRKFIFGSGALILGTGLAAATGNLPRIKFNEQPLEEYDNRFIETVNKYPSSRFYYHNAANNPTRFERALASPALNIEADVVNLDGELYIAHSVSELIKNLKKYPEYHEIQKADYVFRKIVESGKNPAIDIKLNRYDQDGFDLLMHTVNENIPEDSVVTTFSGEIEHVFKINDRPNSIVVPTINQWEIPDYIDRSNKWKDIDPAYMRFGATVDSNLWDDELQYLLGYNRNRGLETNVYTVNNESRIVTLLDWGATGITSDEESILSRASQTF